MAYVVLNMPLTPFQTAADQVWALGQTLRRVPGGYIVNFRNGGASTEYQTEDLADAISAAPDKRSPGGCDCGAMTG